LNSEDGYVNLPEEALRGLKKAYAFMDAAVKTLEDDMSLDSRYYERLACVSLEKARFWIRESAESLMMGYGMKREFILEEGQVLPTEKPGTLVKEVLRIIMALPVYTQYTEAINVNLMEAGYFLGRLSENKVEGS
jgi:hypothetical protein